MVRAGFVDDAPPGKPSASAFLRPALGATYAVKLGSGFRLAPFLGVALPLGNGGGNTPDPNVRAALGSGILTRSSMDNALFAVNYLTPFPGIDLAWVKSGLTIQAEVTLFELIRARGDVVDKDAARTNFTSGFHVGYFVIPELSVGGELRYQTLGEESGHRGCGRSSRQLDRRDRPSGPSEGRREYVAAAGRRVRTAAGRSYDRPELPRRSDRSSFRVLKTIQS